MATVGQAIPPLEAGQRLTRAEFLRRWEAQPDVPRAELLGGVVHMPSPVSRLHACLVQDVSGWMVAYRRKTPGCTGGCDGTWLMAGEETPQPDNALWILPEYGGQSSVAGPYCAGAPELVVEVSLSRAVYDRGDKLEAYRRTGVREYAILLPTETEVLWHRLVDGQYHLVTAGADNIWRSDVFPGLWLDADAFFRRDLDRLLTVLEQGLASEDHQRFVERLNHQRTQGNGT